MREKRFTPPSFTFAVAMSLLLLLCVLSSCQGRAKILDDEPHRSEIQIRIEQTTAFSTRIMVYLVVDNYNANRINDSDFDECGIYYRPASQSGNFHKVLVTDFDSQRTLIWMESLERHTTYIITPFVRDGDHKNKEYTGAPIEVTTN